MLRTNPKFVKQSATRVKLSPKTELKNFSKFEIDTIKSFALSDAPSQDAISEIAGIVPFPDGIKNKLENLMGETLSTAKGGFAIIREKTRISICADDTEGRQNGVMTFLRSLEDGFFSDEIIYDTPVLAMRGIKVLMPAREDISEFKRFVDSMTFFRHNTLMLEIGGAMEYKKHPEINEGWVEYCKFMSEYSGKTIDLQEKTFPWRKNSVHCNNGGGSFLTQDELRELVNYCGERNISVIPEVPSTSHCDYMLTKHPELAERCEDPYPDTFCPSNPASYDLLFDILDEVTDVFSPDIINIGHDEYYSINICDRCRKRLLSNEDILAEDINKIHAHLASRGVKTMLWCDKLMNVEQGQGYGGALSYIYFEWDPNKDLLAILRPTWGARNKIPKDIICLNWYHSFGEKYDEEIRDFPTVFGNFCGQFSFRNFRRRVGKNVFGGFASNWGGTTDVYFRRNNVTSAMAYNDVYYWDAAYDDTDDGQYEERMSLVFRALAAYRYERESRIGGSVIEVVHRTDMDVPYRHFVDGVFPEGEEFRKEYLAGQYVIKYGNGTEARTDVFYGEQIINENTPWYGTDRTNEQSTTDAPGLKRARITQSLSALAGEAIPEYVNGKIFCRSYIKNPHPERRIESITPFIPEGASHTLSVISIKVL